MRNELHALEQLSLPEVAHFLEHSLGNLPQSVSLCGHLLRSDDELQSVHDLISQFEQVQLREVDSDGRNPKTDTHYLGFSRSVQIAVLRMEQSTMLNTDEKQAAMSLLAALLALPHSGTPRKLLEAVPGSFNCAEKHMKSVSSVLNEAGCAGEDELADDVLAVFQDAAALSRAAQVLQQYGLMQPGVDGSIGTLHQLVQRAVHEFWLPSSGEANAMAPHVTPVFRAVRQMLVTQFKSSNHPADWS